MKVSDISQYEKPVLVNAVKLSQRKQLLTDKGGWKEWLQSVDPNAKLSDPKHHSVQRLAEFLAALSSQKPDPRAPARELLQPQKLLKRLLPWLQKCRQEEQQLQAQAKKKAAAAAPANPVQAGILSMVQRTQRHPRFKPNYSFNSYEKGWTRTERLVLPDPAHSLVLLALDCEMCATAGSDKELLQVAVVDQDGKQLMKELVQPSSEVLDYRTALTGITAEHLQGVTTTRKAAAARVAALLQPGTVLVGHSLHYDLQSLQLDHQPVIDTALLFSYEGLASATPSLTHLAEQLLGQQLRGGSSSSSQQQQQQQQQPHDSVEDASAALSLVKAELERLRSEEGPTPPLPPPANKVDKEQQSKLCVHKLPDGTTAAAVRSAFVAACKKAAAGAEAAAAEAAAAAVEAAAVEELGGPGSKPQLLLAFPHPGLANDAFAALPGGVFTDSMGRHSKRLQLQGGKQVVVRKMACHSGFAYGKDKAQDRGVKKPGSKQQQKGNKKGSKKRPASSIQSAAAAAAAAAAAKKNQKKSKSSTAAPA
ncbi:hypothetical protein OEZ85_007599 [Tetradesmus obliquus]|uniref:Exonuclease domain-containing protein n=1 Tax=Tetradesmus obliquus TaxID=3088 RepID=A0ABY8TGF1_TETOB|nr:hypothetical protein OEZ85_007599 [Tetradesmus obliquus]